MQGKEIYKIWAPKNADWVNWVRPVSFWSIEKYNRNDISNWIDFKNIFLKSYLENTAIFVDLPGVKSIEFGIALSKIGYRPIPIFNGTDESKNSIGILDNAQLEGALINGAVKLKDIKINNNSNPAFLLDSYRTIRYRKNLSVFDNSWDLYGQDIPSYNYFKSKNIKRIIVVGDNIQRDLRKIFFKFYDIEFFITDGFSPIKKVRLKKTIKERLEKEEL